MTTTTLNIALCKRYGITDKRTNGQTNGRKDRQTDDPNTRCPRRTFQAGGRKGRLQTNEQCLVKSGVQRDRTINHFSSFSIILVNLSNGAISTDASNEIQLNNCFNRHKLKEPWDFQSTWRLQIDIVIKLKYGYWIEWKKKPLLSWIIWRTLSENMGTQSAVPVLSVWCHLLSYRRGSLSCWVELVV